MLERNKMTSSLIFPSIFQAELTTVPEDEDLSLPPPLMASPLKPLKPSPQVIEALEEESEKETEESENEHNENNDHNVSKESNNSVTLLPFDSENPWDLVPDQPANRSSNSLVIPITTNGSSNNTNANLLSNLNNKKIEELSKSSSQNLMDDPFDADWVSLALNENNQQTQQPL